jgi:hypothetical protein
MAAFRAQQNLLRDVLKKLDCTRSSIAIIRSLVSKK